MEHEKQQEQRYNSSLEAEYNSNKREIVEYDCKNTMFYYALTVDVCELCAKHTNTKNTPDIVTRLIYYSFVTPSNSFV